MICNTAYSPFHDAFFPYKIMSFTVQNLEPHVAQAIGEGVNGALRDERVLVTPDSRDGGLDFRVTEPERMVLFQGNEDIQKLALHVWFGRPDLVHGKVKGHVSRANDVAERAVRREIGG